MDMGHADRVYTLFLLAVWTTGTILGGGVGRWVRPSSLAFPAGATVGAVCSALLCAVLTCFGPNTSAATGDLVLVYLPPALMAGLTAAALREHLDLYRKALSGSGFKRIVPTGGAREARPSHAYAIRRPADALREERDLMTIQLEEKT